MRLFRSRKAQESEIPLIGKKMIFFAVTAVILGMLAVGYVMSTASYVYKTTSLPKGLQHELYASRFFSYAGCFAYQDPNTQRTYPYYVQLDKFTDERFRECLQFPLSKDDLCYELRLARSDASGIDGSELRVIHSNNYERSCVNDATVNAAKRPVVIVEGDRRSAGMVTVLEFTKEAVT